MATPVKDEQKQMVDFTYLSLVGNEHFDGLGLSSAIRTEASMVPNGVLVNKIRKVTGGFEIDYETEVPKNRLKPAAGRMKAQVTRFIPFSFIKSAKSGAVVGNE